MSSINKQKVLFLDKKFGNLVLDTADIWKPGPKELLVKIHATALNPVDWKIQKYGVFYEDFPAILGTDAAGEVVEVGEGVTKYNKGDRIFFQGAFTNKKSTFQQYTIASEDTVSRIPSSFSHDEVSTIPVGLTCAWTGMYNKNPYGLGIMPPIIVSARRKYTDTPFVILGGASSVAIQLAKLSGFSPIIATASLKHEEFLKSLGANHIIDRNSPLPVLSAEISKITPKPIKHVYDAISSQETQQTAHDLLAPEGQAATTLPPVITVAGDRQVIQVVGILNLPQNIDMLTDMYNVLPQFLEEGWLKPNKLEVLPGGLAGILEGLERLEKSQVSALKLVARPFET